MNWHYAEQGQQIGPVDDVQLAELVRIGKVNADTLVWRDGLADWMPYSQVQGVPTSTAAFLGETERGPTTPHRWKSPRLQWLRQRPI